MDYSDELLTNARDLKATIDRLEHRMAEPKAALSVAKEQIKSKLRLNRAAFDAARKAANRKPPDAQQWFNTIEVCKIAWGVFAQTDIEDQIQEARQLAERNGQELQRLDERAVHRELSSKLLDEPQTTAQAMHAAIEADGGERTATPPPADKKAAARAQATAKAKATKAKRTAPTPKTLRALGIGSNGSKARGRRSSAA